MRLNRGTITLVAIGLIVIVGVLLINNNQANTPDATPTATEQTGGPLFPDLTADALAQVVVRDNSNGARTVLVRTSDGLWELDEPSASSSEVEALEALIATLEATPEAAETTPEATALPESTPDPELDQNTVLTTIDGLVGLTASDRFDLRSVGRIWAKPTVLFHPDDNHRWYRTGTAHRRRKPVGQPLLCGARAALNCGNDPRTVPSGRGNRHCCHRRTHRRGCTGRNRD